MTRDENRRKMYTEFGLEEVLDKLVKESGISWDEILESYTALKDKKRRRDLHGSNYDEPIRKGWFRPSQLAPLFDMGHSGLRARCETGRFRGATKSENGEWMVPLSGVIIALIEEFGSRENGLEGSP